MLFTIGHSTRSFDDFVDLLRAHGVTAVADVRTVPRSRRHPHFAQEALVHTLPAAGIGYRHFPALGRLRRARPDSRNGAWRHPSFRGYADHMGTPAFASSIDALLTWARDQRVAIMCAEAKWWQCHRQLIADAIVARNVEVRHIMSKTTAPPHELTAFARVDGDTVSYPSLI